MPDAATVASHGGVQKVRTRSLSGGRYQHIYVMRDGKVIVAEVQRKKKERA